MLLVLYPDATEQTGEALLARLREAGLEGHPVADQPRRVIRLHGVPVLGLCLGMQAMALAAVRSLPGNGDATLGEIEPEAKAQVFTRLTDGAGLPVDRLGDRMVRLCGKSGLGTRLERHGLETTWIERMNHRYRLDPGYEAVLQRARYRVAARDPGAGVVDVIEGCGAFCAASSGHPELTSREGRPHPLMVAFLRARRSAPD